MQNLLVSTVLVVAAFALGPEARATRSDPVLVQSIPSGDTIVVSTFGRIRLLGIVAPPRPRRAPASVLERDEARERLTSLVLNRWVRLEWDAARDERSSSRRDGARATPRAAYVMLEEGTFVNAKLVREGLVCVSARTGGSRLAELQRAESEARAARRGVWGTPPAGASSKAKRGCRSSAGRP